MESIGKERRLNKLFDPISKRTVIVPVDDILLAGPEGGLRSIEEKIVQIVKGNADAIIAFPGLFKKHHRLIKDSNGIVNLTASSTRSVHTRKVLISSVETAVKLGMQCVAVHVNISSMYEFEMLNILGNISVECENYGMPLMGIMYPRSEKDGSDYNYEDIIEKDPEKYAALARHTARIAVDLGVDIIKTQYTGNIETFKTVIDCCSEVPVVIAGGPKLDAQQMLSKAKDAITAGASGISFGRNVFNHDDSSKYIMAIRKIVHENASIEEAYSLIKKKQE